MKLSNKKFLQSSGAVLVEDKVELEFCFNSNPISKMSFQKGLYKFLGS